MPPPVKDFQAVSNCGSARLQHNVGGRTPSRAGDAPAAACLRCCGSGQDDNPKASLGGVMGFWIFSVTRPSSGRRDGSGGGSCRGVSSLQRLCERSVARSLVEPRTALALLEYADAAGAEMLRQHCIAVSCMQALLLAAPRLHGLPLVRL